MLLLLFCCMVITHHKLLATGSIDITQSGGVPGDGSNGHPMYTYIWSGGTTSVNTDGSIGTSSALTASNYDVTVTDATGCSKTFTLTVTANQTCCGAAANNINSQGDFDALGNSISGSYNLNVSIVLSINVTFTGATFYIAEGVSITVNNGKTLNILNNSHLLSCGGMWQGIINDGGTVTITNSKVEDAEESLRMGVSGSIALISNSIFDGNYINIVLDGQDFSTSQFTGNTFSCINVLQTPHPQSFDFTHTHFQISNATNVTINQNNNFADAHHAITATNSQILVDDCNFNNLANIDPTLPHNYAAILVTDGAATITNNQFINSNMSAYCIGECNSILTNNIVSGGDYGFAINSLYNNTTAINNNVITGANHGIELWNISTNQTINIADNVLSSSYDINSVPNSHVAIELLQPLPYITDVRILRNQVYDYHIGIAAVGAYGNDGTHTRIEDNNITYKFTENDIGTENYYGIFAQGCQQITIHGNTIDWHDMANDPTQYAGQVQGIRAQTNNTANIDNNTMIETGAGIWMQDDCPANFLTCNYFENAAPGVFMDNVLNFPDQGTNNTPTYNTWVGNYQGQQNQKFKIDGYTGNGNPVTFWYDGIAQNSSTRYPRPSPPPLIDPAPIIYNSAFNCGVIPNIIANDSTAEEEIMEDALNNSTANDSLAAYYSERFAYNAMNRDSGLISDPVRFAFYQQKKLENTGRLAEVIKHLQLNELDSAYMITGLVTNPLITEQNLVDAYQVLLPALSMDKKSITNSDSALFENTMYQNAYEQGNAAFMKRAYLRKIIVDHHIGSLRVFNKSSINDHSKNYLLVYPNPLHKNLILSIQIVGSPITKFIVTDFAGRIVSSLELNPVNHMSYDCENLSSGIYFVQLKLQDGSTSPAKFIVQ